MTKERTKRNQVSVRSSVRLSVGRSVERAQSAHFVAFLVLLLIATLSWLRLIELLRRPAAYSHFFAYLVPWIWVLDIGYSYYEFHKRSFLSAITIILILKASPPET